MPCSTSPKVFPGGGRKKKGGDGEVSSSSPSLYREREGGETAVF